MVTAVDSSVLLDVLTADPIHENASKTALAKAGQLGRLILCETVIAEISPALSKEDLDLFLAECALDFIPHSLSSAKIAGEYFAQYLKRGGKRARVVPDFLIASHALVHADRLLARDRGYYRDYFEQLTLIEPEV
jgi:hypothetical protein